MESAGFANKVRWALADSGSVKGNQDWAWFPPDFEKGNSMAFKQSLNRAVKALSAYRRFPDTMSPTSVSDVMTRDVLSVYPSQSFAETVGLMANRPFRHVLVIHPNGRLAGVISDRDLLRAMGATCDWKEKKVSDVMTRDVFTVTPETSLSAAAREMLARRVNCLPVLYDGNKQVCGIVTSTDLLTVFEKLQTSVEKMTR
jgi:CBS domain-containing protein